MPIVTLFNHGQFIPKKYNNKVNDPNHVPLIQGQYTPNTTTKAFQYAQFFYHGDHLWTVITYAIDTKQGLKLRRGRLLEDILAFDDHKFCKKDIPIYISKFTGRPETNSLRIKTMSTMVIQDDKHMTQALPADTDTWGVAQVDGKNVQVYDARQGKYRTFYSEPWNLPESDDEFIERLIQALGHYYPSTPTRSQIIEMVCKNLRHRDDYIYHEYLKGNVSA